MLLVFRYGRVDEVRPGIDSAFKITHLGETSLFQQSHGLRAAAAAVTMDDERLLAVQLLCALKDFAERDQFRAIDSCDLKFERFPYIDQLECIPRVHLPFQFLLRYCRNACVVIPRAAKLVVINRRKDCWVLAANGTLRIAPQL